VFALANVLSATAATFSSQGILRLTRALVHLQLHYKRAARILPIKQACRQALGEPVPYLEQWLDHEDPGDTLWRGLRVDLARWRVPTALQGGWYDAVLDQTLAQYAELKANGCEVSLLVGPWSHSSAFTRDGLRVISRQALAWMTERLADDGGAEDKPGAPVGFRAVLHLRASTGHAHVFVRLCDVDPQGRSRNVTDGILRLTPGALAEEAVTVPMSSAAHQFAPGHRLRLQVSGGAHPRFARSTGTGEPLATATRLVPTDIEVYHDQARPSALLLPADDTTAGQ
jgi:predicted acyl esterase